MEWLIFGVVALVSLFLGTGVVAAPLAIGCLLASLILFTKPQMLLLAFCLGILTDILAFQTVGLTSIFFVLLLGAVFVYERRFEIHTLQFVVAFSFLASMVYLFFSHASHVLLSSLVTAVWASAVFFLLAILDTKLPAKKKKALY